MVKDIFYYTVKARVSYDGDKKRTVCCKLRIKSLATNDEKESGTLEKSCSPGSSVKFEWPTSIEHKIDERVKVYVDTWLKDKPSVKDSESKKIKPPFYVTDRGFPTLVNLDENIYAYVKVKNVSDRRAKFRIVRVLVDPYGITHESMSGFEVEEYLSPGEEKKYSIWGITCKRCWATHSTYRDACSLTGWWINKIKVYKDGDLVATFEETTWVGG